MPKREVIADLNPLAQWETYCVGDIATKAAWLRSAAVRWLDTAKEIAKRGAGVKVFRKVAKGSFEEKCQDELALQGSLISECLITGKGQLLRDLAEIIEHQKDPWQPPLDFERAWLCWFFNHRTGEQPPFASPLTFPEVWAQYEAACDSCTFTHNPIDVAQFRRALKELKIRLRPGKRGRHAGSGIIRTILLGP